MRLHQIGIKSMRRHVDFITSAMDLVGLILTALPFIFIPKPVKFTFSSEYGIITSLQPVADAINAVSRDIRLIKWVLLGFAILVASSVVKVIKHAKSKSIPKIAKEIIIEQRNGTYFFDEEGKRLGSDDGVVPIPLYKGMRITIHGYDDIFEVADWNYHHGHPDEQAGLRIILKRGMNVTLPIA